MNSHVREIEKALLSFPARTSSHHPESYIGGGQSRLRYIGLRVPHLRQAMRQGFSFSRKSTAELAQIWNQVWWESDCFEVMALALAWFYEPQQKAVLCDSWPLLQKWSSRIDNWAHSDTLSGLYARILEQNPQVVYPTLVDWSLSDQPWLRRLSVVSLLYYSSQRKKVLPFKKIRALVHPQIEFAHYYVQKGVGWTLRESSNVYPTETYAYLKKNISKVSSHAFSAATEKLPPRKKQLLKRLRKTKKLKIQRTRR